MTTQEQESKQYMFMILLASKITKIKNYNIKKNCFKGTKW